MRLYKICWSHVILMKIVYMYTVQVLLYFVNFLLCLGIVNWFFMKSVSVTFCIVIHKFPLSWQWKVAKCMHSVSSSWRKVLMSVCNVSLIIFDKNPNKYFWEKINVRHPEDALYSFSIKNIFYDKMDLRLFYFHATTCKESRAYYRKKLGNTAQCSPPPLPISAGGEGVWKIFNLGQKREAPALFEFLGGSGFFWGKDAEVFLKVILIK